MRIVRRGSSGRQARARIARLGPSTSALLLAYGASDEEAATRKITAPNLTSSLFRKTGGEASVRSFPAIGIAGISAIQAPALCDRFFVVALLLVENRRWNGEDSDRRRRIGCRKSVTSWSARRTIWPLRWNWLRARSTPPSCDVQPYYPRKVANAPTRETRRTTLSQRRVDRINRL
jgi:hypothetical protein